MIELDEVAYSYGGDALLQSVSLTLAPGSFHFLTGPSGSGKTTLLKLCYGALLPASGRVRIFEADIHRFDRDQMAPMRHRIGVVHQDCRFLDRLPLADNVALPLTVSGRDLQAEADNLGEFLFWVGHANRSDALPPELSGASVSGRPWRGRRSCRRMWFWSMSPRAMWIGTCRNVCCGC